MATTTPRRSFAWGWRWTRGTCGGMPGEGIGEDDDSDEERASA
jgi:hypothetical protein